MPATTAITSLILNDGTAVDLQDSGVVLFVGPNNAGKSQALRDLAKLATSGDSTGVVIRSATVKYRGTAQELVDRMSADRAIVHSVDAGDVVDLGGSIQSVANIQSWWAGGAPYIVGKYFVTLADTESRLNASRPTDAMDLYMGNPLHALHKLYASPDLESRLRGISRDAFGQGLILDVWAGGSQWALRVGEIDAPNGPRPDQAFLDALRELPLLHNQGDGMRSMMGLLLTLLTGHQSISLVDEPEAFLHPPQARFLARLLSDDAAREARTIFLSTHSSDVVHGTLEGTAPTTVVRLRRSGNVNEAAVLDNEAVRRLWSDPLLKYSNLLEGLFTDAVVVCESDADCKFFASIRDTLEPASIDARRPDILFTSCGGKSRMHVGVEALRAASVPVVVVGDFDVLNDWSTLSRLILKAGGSADALEKDWRVLNSALTSNPRTPSVAGMSAAVAAAFEGLSEVTAKSLAPVREALKIENGWDRVKNTGLAGVPKGDAYSAASRLLIALRELRIFLIPLGEMEDFVPSVSGHGPNWLAEVLEQRLHESSDGDRARDFFRDVVEAIAGNEGVSSICKGFDGRVYIIRGTNRSIAPRPITAPSRCDRKPGSRIERGSTARPQALQPRGVRVKTSRAQAVLDRQPKNWFRSTKCVERVCLETHTFLVSGRFPRPDSCRRKPIPLHEGLFAQRSPATRGRGPLFSCGNRMATLYEK